MPTSVSKSQFPTIDEIAQELIKFYREKFGGKLKGKFRIPYQGAQAIFGRIKVRGVIYDDVEMILNKHGYVIVDLGEEFVIIAIRYLKNIRGLPKALWLPFAEDDSEPEDEE